MTPRPGRIGRRCPRKLARFRARKRQRRLRTSAVCGACCRIEGGTEVGYTFRWTHAGHPPPLVVTADGATRYLAPARHGIPVGIEPSVPRFDHAHPLPPGATLLLFTDGLVERRDEDIDVGLRALAGHASRLVGAPVDVLCDELMAGHGQKFDDDVALLALRLPGTAGS
ncbi:PP2C family protein-serine/threonine phosphatase [Streptomyces sparsogenes]|uniref:PP2C family protein-serine/threonine phosphatase n=1 Tax=Streptomyces sparsogenes TaxID=67365 RepID=UPI00340E685A